MAMSRRSRVPSTPRVISPSPTASESAESPGSYFAPVTRSTVKKANSSKAITEEGGDESDGDKRARARSRSPTKLSRRRISGAASTKNKSSVQEPEPLAAYSVANGHLSPASAATSYLRDISRSPSPRLIPIHRSWRSFIHRHEIPRKMLHVSIGFFTLKFYASGLQPSHIHPWLLSAVVPIAAVDILRHNSNSFNRIYVRVLGALMRESEVNERYNGVIFYLLGAWVSLRFFPKDVGVMSVLLLSWCDTAASTFGRLYGRYTPQIRKGKSLAGTAAAALVGMLTSVAFFGYFVPKHFGFEDSFMFKDHLSLPQSLCDFLGPKTLSCPPIFGGAALSVISVWSGLVASFSELVDIFGIDDNLTIPVLSGIGLWGFLRIFG